MWWSPQPAEPDCYRDTDTGDTFVLLRNVRGVLAAYREHAKGHSLRYLDPAGMPTSLRRAIER